MKRKALTDLLLRLLLPLFLFATLMDSCTGREERPAVDASAAEAELAEDGEPEASGSFTLIAVGDNLYHNVLFRANAEGVRDFTPYYASVKPLVQSADIAFVNQETVFAGTAAGFSGYPRFNTPFEAGLALIDSGFNVVSHANNHAMDKGESGVLSTMDYWEQHPEITVLGIHRSQEARDKPSLVEANGVKVGFLSYTYGTNGLPVPAKKPYLVSLIDTDVMEQEISALRPHCDFLVVSMHWGNEYEHTPTARQKELAAFLAEFGVDLVIAHHPHVLQPMEFLPRQDGGWTLVVYSLGNFLSAQRNNNRLLGGMLYLRARKIDGLLSSLFERDALLQYLKSRKTDGTVLIEKAGIIPLVTHYDSEFDNFGVYPLYDYTEELASTHRNRVNSGLGFSSIGVDYFRKLAASVLGKSLIEGDPFAPSALAD